MISTTTSENTQVGLQLDEGVLQLTLNRPEKLNALTESMLEDLDRGIVAAQESDDVLGVVITGAGTAFSSGQDLNSTPQTQRDVERVIELFNNITRSILTSSKPTIAAINGIAVGGGMEITLACDMRIAADDAEAFFPENLRGLAISNGSSYLLPRLVGSHALGLVMDSRRLEASEALRIGLFDALVPSDQVLTVASETVRRWGDSQAATAQHLRLMRPPVDEVEAAMRREVSGARELVLLGHMRNGVHQYLGND